MKSKTCLRNGLIIGFLASLIGVLGFSIGNSMIGKYNPSWTHYPIESAPKEVIDIVYIDIRSTVDDPTGDILYAATKNGEIYSNTVFQNDWLLVDPVPVWDNNYTTECATEWPGPSDAHMWDTPPIEKGAIDSVGVRFERPVSIIARCYVLSDDGSLEVWIHSGNAMELMAGEFLKMMFAIFGVILGIIIGVIIIRPRKRAESPTT